MSSNGVGDGAGDVMRESYAPAVICHPERSEGSTRRISWPVLPLGPHARSLVAVAPRDDKELALEMTTKLVRLDLHRSVSAERSTAGIRIRPQFLTPRVALATLACVVRLRLGDLGVREVTPGNSGAGAGGLRARWIVGRVTRWILTRGIPVGLSIGCAHGDLLPEKRDAKGEQDVRPPPPPDALTLTSSGATLDRTCPHPNALIPVPEQAFLGANSEVITSHGLPSP